VFGETPSWRLVNQRQDSFLDRTPTEHSNQIQTVASYWPVLAVIVAPLGGSSNTRATQHRNPIVLLYARNRLSSHLPPLSAAGRKLSLILGYVLLVFFRNQYC